MTIPTPVDAPILEERAHAAPSVFTARGLLDAARLQKGLPRNTVPPVCVLDPDVDLTRHLRMSGRATPDPHWACYHTELLRLPAVPLEIGLVAGAVGAPFAVLVAEQLFASGCRLLISLTSAGQLQALRPPPYYILIERALRDEGTSYHYEAAARFSEGPADLIRLLDGAFDHHGVAMVKGATWTTDAPFRETATLIEARRREGLLAVEMEAAALYALARRQKLPILCFALVTNQMATAASDFDKGKSNGIDDALSVIAAVIDRLKGHDLLSGNA